MLKRKSLIALLIAAMFTFSIGTGVAGAAMTVKIGRVPYVNQTMTGPVALAPVTISEDENIPDELQSGDYLSVNLPEGVEWDDSTVVKFNNVALAFGAELKVSSPQSLDIAIPDPTDAKDTLVIEPMVIFDGFNAGEIFISFDVHGGNFPDLKFNDDQEYIANMVAYSVEVTAMEVTDVLANTSAQTLGKIQIKEIFPGSLRADDEIKFTMPAGVTFSNESGYADYKIITGDAEFGPLNYRKDEAILRMLVKKESTEPTIIEIAINKVEVGKDVLGDVRVEVTGARADGNVIVAKCERNLVTQPLGVFVVGETVYAVSGEQQYMAADEVPYIKDNRTYLPLRYVAYCLGIADKDITWDPETGVVTLEKDRTKVTLTIGSMEMQIIGRTVALDVAPEITGDRTMLPVRWVVEAFGYTADWDAETQKVTIR